jgi:L-threonylcarbamoyladenylate synthase
MAELIPYQPTELAHLSTRVKQTLERQGIVAVPTETYYGLGVNPFDERAIARLLKVKGRGDGKPILVLIGSPEQLSLFTPIVSPVGKALIEAFWPGPLTILFPPHPSLPPSLTGGTQTIGVRLTSCPPLAELLQRVGPITGTSANRTGQPPAQTAQAVEAALGSEIEVIVDAGTTPGGMPSTVIDATGTVRIVRDGVLGRSSIEAKLRTRGFFLNLSQM